MLIRILFYFVLFYSLFKFLIRVVLPVIITTGKVRSKMKNMQQNMSDFENTQNVNTGSQSFPNKETSTTTSKGDYIDFEEVK